MKVLMISDASNVEAADAAVLGEVRRALETEAHDVDIVRVNPGLSDDLAAKALALLGNADVVVFGNGDQASKGFVEKLLLLSDGLHAERDALQASNDELTRDNDDLRESNARLTRDNAGLRESNAGLERDNDDLRASNAGLTQDNDDLRRHNDSLQASNDTYARINSSLQESNDELTRDNDSLRASNDTYMRINSSLQESNDSLTRDNVGLRATNDSLTRDNASLRESNDGLQAHNDSLTRDNAGLRESNEGLTRDTDDLRASNVSLRHDSREDALTRVMNRRGLDQDCPAFVRTHANLILISVDINDFKLFNDIFGHHIGDQLLKALAEEFRALVPEDDILARSGGDEFALVIANPTEAWMHKASDFFNRVHSFEFEGVRYTYSLSAGFAAYPEQTDSLETLFRMADSALYHAKMLAKDKFFKYAPEMDNDLRMSLGFNARGLASTAPGAMLIFKAAGSHELLFANTLCAEFFGYPSVSDFMNAERSLSHLVSQDDVDQVDRHIADQVAQPDLHGQTCVSYRVQCGDGRTRPVLAVERMSLNEHFGYIFHAFLFDPAFVGEGLGA